MDQLHRMKKESIPKLILQYSLPAIIAMVIQMLYNIIDRIFIGHVVGPPGIAGLTVAFPLMLIGISFSNLIGVGSSILASITLSKNNYEDANKIVGNAIFFTIAFSVLLTIGGFLFLDKLLVLFGASENILPYARDYTKIILAGTLFLLFGITINGFIRNDGNPRYAMIAMSLGAIINIVLDYFFIVKLGFGITGAALATTFSMFISSLLVFIYFFRKQSTLKIRLKFLRPDISILKKIIIIGAPPFILEIATSILNIILNNQLQKYGGDIALSSMGVIASIFTIIITFIIGLNQGIQPLISYNYGAGLYSRVKKIVKYALLVATIILSLGFLIINVFTIQLISFFIKPDKQFTQVCKEGLKIFLLFLPFIGTQYIGSGYFQAIGKAKLALIVSLTRQIFIFVPLVLILPNFLGVRGIWISGAAADILAFIIIGSLLSYELKKIHD